MAELESMKYFSAGFAETETNPTDPSSAPGAPERLATAQELGLAEWTLGMTVTVILFTLMGGWGFFGSIIEMVGFATLESRIDYLNKFAGITDVTFQVEVVKLQIENRWLLYVGALIRLAVSVGFLGAAAMLKQKKEDANRFAAMVCVGSVFYSLVAMMIGYSMLPDMSSIPGMTQEAVELAMMFTVIMMVVSLGISMLFYGGLIAYLLNKNNRKFFGRKVAPADDAYQSSASAAPTANPYSFSSGQPNPNA
ncbi:MAG: hypothetical protein AAFN77_10100 [Planctomycetota bacterium]